jgi:hypothetical protein
VGWPCKRACCILWCCVIYLRICAVGARSRRSALALVGKVQVNVESESARELGCAGFLYKFELRTTLLRLVFSIRALSHLIRSLKIFSLTGVVFGVLVVLPPSSAGCSDQHVFILSRLFLLQSFQSTLCYTVLPMALDPLSYLLGPLGLCPFLVAYFLRAVLVSLPLVSINCIRLLSARGCPYDATNCIRVLRCHFRAAPMTLRNCRRYLSALLPGHHTMGLTLLPYHLRSHSKGLFRIPYRCELICVSMAIAF